MVHIAQRRRDIGAMYDGLNHISLYVEDGVEITILITDGWKSTGGH